MRAALLTLCLVTITGCNLPNPFEFAESSNNCLGPFNAPAGVRLDGDAIRSNELLLKRIFIHAGLMESNKEFCLSFGGIPIRYVAEWTVPCPSGDPPGKVCDGVNDSHGITMNRKGDILLHELMHSYEFERFIWNTQRHPRWEEKGYNALEERYMQEATPAYPPLEKDGAH